MALFDYAADEVIARIVYYGPDEAGKTTNLRHIYGTLPSLNKGELLTLSAETGRTLVFDFVPSEPGRIKGLRMRVQLCCLTGSVSSATARRAVLKGADGVVFVADSREEALDADAQSLEGLYRNLERIRTGGPAIPMFVQFNKRDLATAVPLETLGQRLNPRGLPALEAIATQGIGVEETLRVITRQCFRALAQLYGEAGTPAPGAGVARPTRMPTPQSLAGRMTDAALNRVKERNATLPATKLELPVKRPTLPPSQLSALAREAAPGPARLSTQKSLARDSLPPPADEAAARRSATIPFTKLEQLAKPRAGAEPPAEAPGPAPVADAAPPSKRE